MTSIFLSENTMDDGTVEDEDDFCAAAATFFTGDVSRLNILFDMVLTSTHPQVGSTQLGKILYQGLLYSILIADRHCYHVFCTCNAEKPRGAETRAT